MKEINSVNDINKILKKEEIEKSISSSAKKANKKEDLDNEKLENTKGCKSGFTITDDIIEEDKLKSKVLKYITYKKRTENEIRQKFSEVDNNLLDDIIENFKEQNYINDNDYIERSIKEFMALKKMSIKELTYKLIQKGINTNIIDNYVCINKEMLVNYEIESAKSIIQKKHANLEIEEIKRYLFQKGYMSETVKIAIDEVLE